MSSYHYLNVSFLVVPKQRQLIASGERWVQPRKSNLTEFWVQEQFVPHRTTYALGYMLGPSAKYSSR